MLKGPFTPRTITITIAIVACSPADDKIMFIVSAAVLSSVALNIRAWMDSDWLSMFCRPSTGKKIVLKVIPMISFLCVVIVIAVNFEY